MMTTYIGRFAPSPTGPLHAGSLVAALASWLDARAWNSGTGGRWLVRIEDLDTPRNAPGAASTILRQLQACSLVSDQAPEFQSRRTHLYEQAFERLSSRGLVYACGCSRTDILQALERAGRPPPRRGELVYPGTCRTGLRGRATPAWRFRVGAMQEPHASTGDGAVEVHWTDRRLGPQCQDVAGEVGDFVVRRSDGPFAYQLAVVVDDDAQKVNHVVRGEDLADNTARQLLLYAALGLQPPRYLHTLLVLAPDGEKLSKQNGAAPIDQCDPLGALNEAALTLGCADAAAAWAMRSQPGSAHGVVSTIPDRDVTRPTFSHRCTG